MRAPKRSGSKAAMSWMLTSVGLVGLFAAGALGFFRARAVAKWHSGTIERLLGSAPGNVPGFILERSRKSVSSLTRRYRFIFALTAAVSLIALWAIWLGPRGAR